MMMGGILKHRVLDLIQNVYQCLNPCCSGSGSVRYDWGKIKIYDQEVLILVVAEVALWVYR
jgi:uncharacterized protein (DUF779 family)